MTPDHFLEVTGGEYRTTVVCTAGPGDPCRMVCPTCEESCICEEPVLKDMGECNWSLWLNSDNPMECGEGTARLPIDIEWCGDNYEWQFIETTAEPP